MRFSFHALLCPAEQYLPLAKASEKAGFDGFTIPDSICYPKIADTKYPYNADGSRNFLENTPFMEPFSLIPAMAAVTEKLTFTTSVLKLAIRNPVLVAKSLTTINVLSGNRFSMGAGLSPWVEDFEICAEPWAGRGKRMEEMIEIIRGLHSGDYYEFKGDYYDIPACKLCPAPTKPTPILIGGHSDAALNRAARIGDGWIHAGGDINSLKPLISRLNTLREENGTLDKPFEIQAATPDAFSLDGVRQLAEIGVTECVIGFRDLYSGEPDNKTLEQKIGEIQWFADTIIERL
jgi:probable F420-dependent oxidoreductase